MGNLSARIKIHKSIFKNNNYKAVDTIFEGMKIDICKSPMDLHKILEHVKHVDISILRGVYFVTLRGVYIANIDDMTLTLTPSMFLHRNLDVFKTYNKIIRYIATGKKFIKLIDLKWTLCEDN